jgi:hypothetical protein
MRKVTVTYSFRENGSVPMIRLRGKWLQLAGFAEGTLVQVEVAAGKMVLTVAGETPGESSR